MGRPIASFALLSVSAAFGGGCATAPPSNADIADACRLMSDHRDWYSALKRSSAKWDAPIGLELAIIRQESDFDGQARPARGPRKFFGLIEGDRPSTAFGYSQALETTWQVYKRDVGNGAADRHSFRDSVDFIGWYVSSTTRQAKVKVHDYKAQYLAYHEGASGYVKGTWRGKTWLVQRASQVSVQAMRYQTQIEGCSALRPKFLGIF